MTNNRIVKASALACLCLLAAPTVASAGGFDDQARWSADHGVQLSMLMDFGAADHQRNGLSLTMGYGQPQPSERRLAPLPLLQARYAGGQWRSLQISGVDVMTLNQRLNADGESSSWTPWIIGGLVGAGAVAIVVRYVTNDSTPQTNLGQPVNPPR